MIDTKRLRCWIGALGMALPWIVLALSLAFGYGWPNSISATYFSDPCITPFMIILGSAGILLFNYRGYNKLDDILNSSAGAFGLGICLFPCAATMLERIGTFQIPAEISDTIHMISAIGFFAILAYNSMFQFTKGSENPTPNKLKRNLIFRICGGGMATSFAALPIFTYIEVPHATWWVEMVALTFFGVSWLTKANCIPFLFRDKE